MIESVKMISIYDGTPITTTYSKPSNKFNFFFNSDYLLFVEQKTYSVSEKNVKMENS